MRFRKRPVVVEAVRWMNEDDPMKGHVGNDHAAEFLGVDYRWIDGDELAIGTLEDGTKNQAKHIATRGDWLIMGVQGEHYAVKPDIFDATYESAE